MDARESVEQGMDHSRDIQFRAEYIASTVQQNIVDAIEQTPYNMSAAVGDPVLGWIDQGLTQHGTSCVLHAA